jgi:hypothetical protein
MKAHSPTHGLTAQLLRLAARPPAARRDAAMAKLQAKIKAAEERVSPRIVRMPEDALPAGQIAEDFEAPDPKLVERILANDVLLPAVRWLLDADGRGAFNVEAIALRVTALAWLLDPSLVLGASERKLAAHLGVSHENLARSVRTVTEQLGIGNHTAGALKKAAGKCAEKFSSITRRSRAA